MQTFHQQPPDLMNKPCDAWSTVLFPKMSSPLSSTRSSRVEGRPACFVVFKGKMLRSSSTYWMRHVSTLSMSKNGLIYLSFDFDGQIDQALDGFCLPSGIRKKCTNSLYKICAHYAMFPTSLRIELHDNPTKVVLYRGGFGDVSKRCYQGREVAVKTLRICTPGDLQTITHVGCRRCSVPCAIIDCGRYRGFARSLCRGRLFGIQTCCNW